MNIERITHLAPWRQALCALLDDCVASDASVGFLAPLASQEAERYWQQVAEDVETGHRELLLMLDGDQVTGAVQLSLCGKANGIHRAEVEKLMVDTRYRQRGIGKALMQEVERQARARQRSLLVLDTRTGDPASMLYRSLGYQEAGRIPDFAINSDGSLAGTTIFYKRLSADSP
ncbi:GNAT family N-acetyltransferase [Enterobacteriaceae bacterium BIT-l23]|uniref:GNAT family N-acetyltransferase n=1 Tax=Jejubacter sp. L23 TaxID=3092086 RepID=UPI0015845A63|nr:GNAT family N-acetyltransferase [Enterobacteriaceae bacterium BIT-l23]